jgi:heat shock protein HtpX
MIRHLGDVLSDVGRTGPLKEFIVHSHHNGLKTAALLGLLTAMILAAGYWLGGSGGLGFCRRAFAGAQRR